MDCPPNIREQAAKAQAANKPPEEEELEWWQSSSVYQVLIPSFKDTNGDGKGDLGGVIDNLDYLVDLGIDIVWLTPIFDSPMYDMGYDDLNSAKKKLTDSESACRYDIRNYFEVNPVYGTLDDMDRLIRIAHEKGLKVIIDIALNHTSVEVSMSYKV
jgi:alpha-glucosidase/glucan 1,6-alpha-glucosidase